jgi:hypothetical protein
MGVRFPLGVQNYIWWLSFSGRTLGCGPKNKGSIPFSHPRYDLVVKLDITTDGVYPVQSVLIVPIAQWIECLAFLPAVNAFVVKWISHLASDQEFQVRVLAKAQHCKRGIKRL